MAKLGAVFAPADCACHRRGFCYHWGMKYGTKYTLAALFAALLLFGCSRKSADISFDGVDGTISTNHSVDQSVIAPDEIKVDSDYDHFTIIEHLVFLGQRDTVRRAVTVTFRRSLNDNEFIRAERDFSGFVFNGSFWQALPYTKARHDSTRLDIGYDFPAGGLDWQPGHKSGRLRYDWRGVKVSVDISDLVAVQSNRHGDSNRRSHAIGKGVMAFGADTLAGTVVYELIQVEDYNPINKIGTGIEFTNYDWLVLSGAAGQIVLASSDSTTAGDKILKNFVVLRDDAGVKFADGSARVRINSDALLRDRKIYDTIALKKSLSVPELGLAFKIDLVEPRIFYTSGYCLSVVSGTMESAANSHSAWGIVEHWQQPKSDGSVLR